MTSPIICFHYILAADFTSEAMEIRRKWNNLFKVPGKKKDGQLRILYLAEITFRSEGEVKTFFGERKRREFIASKLALRDLLKEILQT